MGRPLERALGYYTRIDLINVRVKPEHIQRVGRAIQGRVKGTEEFRYMLKCLSIRPDGALDWAMDSVGKWYRDEEFVAWLAEYRSGGFVALWGQEGKGDAWAYEFDGRRGVSACSARRAAAKKGILARRARAGGVGTSKSNSGS